MPTHEGIIQASVCLIKMLREDYGWTWVDMQDAQTHAGIDKDDRCSAQLLRIFYQWQVSKDPQRMGKMVPGPAKLENFLKTFKGQVVVVLPDLADIGKPADYIAKLKK